MTDFTLGQRVGWCGRCGHFFDGDPERCENCGASFEPTGTATVTAVDRAAGTITVNSEPNRAERRLRK